MKLGLVVWALLIHTLFDITFFLFFNCHELAFTVIPNPKLKIERGEGGGGGGRERFYSRKIDFVKNLIV